MNVNKYGFKKLSNDDLVKISAGHSSIIPQLFIQKSFKHKKHFVSGNSHGFGKKSGGGAF